MNKKVITVPITTSIIVLLVGCSSDSSALSESSRSTDSQGEVTVDEVGTPKEDAYMLQQSIPLSFNVTTTSLKNTGFLQPEFTCEGTDSSPHIAWEEVPSNTESIVVVAEDLDLAGAVASHWIVWGLSPDVRDISAGSSGLGTLPKGAVEGVNSYELSGYKGPCPPPKIIPGSPSCKSTGFESNPYRWNVYALDKKIDLGPEATRDDLIPAIDGSILATGTLDIKYISKTLIYASVGCKGAAGR